MSNVIHLFPSAPVTKTTEEQKFPAIYLPKRDENKTSDKYIFVDTREIVEGFKELGLTVRKAQQQGRGPSAKHMVRMTMLDQPRIGGSCPEVVIMNSHNGTTPLKILLGAFRLVCRNGLVVADKTEESVRIRHLGGSVLPAVKEAHERIVAKLPLLVEEIKLMEGNLVTPEMINQYAKQALELVELEVTEENIRKVNLARRHEDEAPNMYALMNRVQENLLRGGVLYEGRARRTKEITQIDKNINLNKVLWKNAVEMIKVA